MSEHAFFEFDVTLVSCTECKTHTILGGNRWIRAPKFMGDKRHLMGVPVSITDEQKGELQEFEDARRDATARLRVLATEVHDKKHPPLKPPTGFFATIDKVSSDLVAHQQQAKAIAEALKINQGTVSVPDEPEPINLSFDSDETVYKDVRYGPNPVKLEPTQETWHDRKPLL